MSDTDPTQETRTELYGLKNCDTCRAALKAFKAAGKPVEFVDVRADPLPEDFLAQLMYSFGIDTLNRRSTTWRNLAPEEREKSPLELLKAYPTLMKRPVIRQNDSLYLGWTDAVRAAVLG